MLENFSISRIYFAALCAVLCIALVPIWSFSYIPLGDYPIHLARCFTLFHYESVSLFQQKYLVLHEPIPNIAEEVIIPFFMRWVSVYTAGRLFISLCLILFTIGTFLLERTAKQGYIALLAPFLYYCNQFFWGTLNYMFGLGIFFIAFAIWYRSRDSWNVRNWVAIAFLLPILYLSHLAAFGLMAVACATTLLRDSWRTRKLNRSAIPSLLPFLPPVILYALFMHGTGRLGEVVWASPWQKVIALVPFLTHHFVVDAALMTLLAGVTWSFVHNRQRIEIQRDYLSISIVFCILFLLCPRALYTSYGADVRFLVPCWIFGLLSFRLSYNPLRYMLALTLALMIVREAAIWSDWSKASATISKQVGLFHQIPLESRIYPALDLQLISANRSLKPLQFASCYAVIDRLAFTPSLIARRGQQPLVWHNSSDAATLLTIGLESLDSNTQSEWHSVLANFDYVFCIGKVPPTLRALTTTSDSTQEAGLLKVRF